MPIRGLGIDLCSIDRIRRCYQQHTHFFLQKILTQREQQIATTFGDPGPFIAGRFAIKEAVLKALGIGACRGFKFQEMEVLPNHLGQPQLSLFASLKDQVNAQKISDVWISLSHEKTHAVAIVLLSQA